MARTGRPPKTKNIYNEDLKRRFIEENYTNLGTMERYLKVFKRSYEYENELQKDIYDFNLPEITDMMTYFSRTMPSTVNSEISIIKNYIQWAINEKLTDSVINVVEQYLNKSVKNELVSKVAQEFKFLRNKDDLMNLVNACKNAQDAVVFVLAFYGFRAEDMINLSIDHIHGNNIDLEYDIFREDKNEETGEITKVKTGHVSRKFFIEDKFMEVVFEAYNQTIYIKNNGIEVPNIMTMEIALDSTRHILKGIVNKGKTNSVLTKQVLNNRIKKIVNTFGQIDKYKHLRESFKLLTLGNMFYSGLFIHLHEIERNKGSLEAQDYISIREQYGLKTINWSDTKNRYEEWKKNI